MSKPHQIYPKNTLKNTLQTTKNMLKTHPKNISKTHQKPPKKHVKNTPKTFNRHIKYTKKTCQKHPKKHSIDTRLMRIKQHAKKTFKTHDEAH